jgi:membrane protein DedA with SNARE-associated domain
MAKTSAGPSVRYRVPLLVGAAARTVLGLIAIPLAPGLYRHHFVVLVLLRPTKEVLLAAGFLARRDEVNLVSVLVAAVPLAVFGVWHFYFLGRGWRKEIRAGKGLPRWASRLLPAKRISALNEVLDDKGWRAVVLGRLAAFPSSLMAAAAGAADMSPRDFLPWDALGAALSVAEVVAAGYVLGEAYKKAGPWLTGLGLLVAVAVVVMLGRWLKRESG